MSRMRVWHGRIAGAGKIAAVQQCYERGSMAIYRQWVAEDEGGGGYRSRVATGQGEAKQKSVLDEQRYTLMKRDHGLRVRSS